MTATETFSEKTRISLVYLINDLFPPPIRQWMGGTTGGREITKLEELTRRKLQILSLGSEHLEIEEKIRHFILTAPDGDLWEMIRMVPLAQILAEEEAQREISIYSRFSRVDIEKKVKSVLEALNSFFVHSGLNARLNENAELRIGGIEVTIPQELTALEGKNKLVADTNHELQQLPISVVGIDLDGFKAVNDNKGHQAGDVCLARVVTAISIVIRGKGRLYRPGGDEFVVLLPNFSAQEGAACAERIRASIERADAGDGLPITASIGVACCSAECDMTAEQILEAADDAMYKSKKSGKNRVTMSDSN